MHGSILYVISSICCITLWEVVMKQKHCDHGQDQISAFRCSKGIRDLLRLVRKVERRNQRKRYMSKKAACIAHSERRARQRFGIALSRGIRQAVEKQIRNGEALSLLKQSCAKHHYAVVAGGTIIPIVWDKVRKVIVTVLPPKTLKPYAEQMAQHWNGYVLPAALR